MIRVVRDVSYSFWAGVENKDAFAPSCERRVAHGSSSKGSHCFELVLGDHKFSVRWDEWDELIKAVEGMRQAMKEAQD